MLTGPGNADWPGTPRLPVREVMSLPAGLKRHISIISEFASGREAAGHGGPGARVAPAGFRLPKPLMWPLAPP